MIRHFFLDKTNTIIKNSKQNYGLNPILSICYGNSTSRGLIHFDIDEIKEFIYNNAWGELNDLKFTLKMTNCFSIGGISHENEITYGLNKTCERASSCDIMLFELPCNFDEGRGFDFHNDFWIHNIKSFSTEGSTWKNARTGFPWRIALNPEDKYHEKEDEGGIYTISELETEYDKFLNNEESIIIGVQHFDFGQENLCIDITKYVLKCLKGGDNNGLCLSFIPHYENIKHDKNMILNFFTDHTNTFFHPYIEFENKNIIKDNRQSFTIGEINKLYLYVFEDGVPTNLDKIPVCKINEHEFSVKQASKGVYYAIIEPNIITMEKDVIYYDIWSEIVLNGQLHENIELEFIAHDLSHKLIIGSNNYTKKELIPYLYGINDSENISRGEIREINIDFKEKYNSEKKELIKTAYYRLYIKDGEREIDVIDYQPIEIGYLNNFFLIYTMDLIPNKYYIDIKVSTGREVLMYKDVLHFNILNNVTERYQ